MEVYWKLYEAELFIILIASVILAIIYIYAHLEVKEFKKTNENYQESPAYIKVMKQKRNTKIVTLSLIIGSICSMIFFRFYEPPLEEQQATYKKWTEELFKEMNKVDANKAKVVESIGASTNSKRDCLEAQKLLKEMPKVLEEASKKLSASPPRVLNYDSRVQLARAVLSIEDSINILDLFAGKMLSVEYDLERIYKGKGNPDDIVEGMEESRKMIEIFNSLQRSIAMDIFTAGTNIGLMYRNGTFVKLDDIDGQNNQINAKTDKKNSDVVEKKKDDGYNSQASTALSLGGISLKDTENDVKSILGTPISTKQQNDGVIVHQYKDVEVHLANGQVQMLVSNSPNAQTSRGIHEQSSIHDAVKAYGGAYETSEYGNYDLIEYKVNDAKIGECIIRFAVEKNNNKVNYISIRRAG